MARPLRLQFEGGVYHVVVRANHRQCLFRDHLDRRRYLELLKRYKSQFEFYLYAYALAQGSVHLLMETPRGDIGKIMQCLGTSYTSHFNRRHRRRGSLFDGRYRSYLIDKGSHLAEVSRYVHRGHYSYMRSSPKIKRDCLWSSYSIYLGKRATEIVDTGPVLGSFGRTLRERRKRYRNFVEDPNLKGNPYPFRVFLQQIVGSQEFVEKVLSGRGGLHAAVANEDQLSLARTIVRRISLSSGVDGGSQLTQRRTDSMARHVAMYLIRKQTRLPLRSIGELLGVKAPAVARAIGRVEGLLVNHSIPDGFKELFESDALLPVRDGSVLPAARENIADAS